MSETKKTFGIIGLGAFGRFMIGHIAPHYDIIGYDIHMPDDMAGARAGTLAEAAAADIVVFAVPLAALAKTAAEAAPHIRPGALVADVTSVKVWPLHILKDLIPEHADLLGTHPLFGPQSGKNGIASLRIALCPVRISQERYYRVCDFLTDTLRLLILKTDPEEHDREIAKVQAMTHFISRALKNIGVAPSPMATRAYEKLQEFSSIVMSDSWDLFLTIEKGNPYADQIRADLMYEFASLEQKMAHDPQSPVRTLRKRY